MDGELVWKRDDFGKMDTRNAFGEGSSPTLVDGMILVPWDHEGPSALYALDQLTGKTLWKTERDDEPTNWCTPFVVEHDGSKQVVINGQTFIRGYDLKTGKELWRIAGKAQRPVTSAVAIDDLVIVASGFQGSYGGAFNLGGAISRGPRTSRGVGKKIPLTSRRHSSRASFSTCTRKSQPPCPA